MLVHTAGACPIGTFPHIDCVYLLSKSWSTFSLPAVLYPHLIDVDFTSTLPTVPTLLLCIFFSPCFFFFFPLPSSCFLTPIPQLFGYFHATNHSAGRLINTPVSFNFSGAVHLTIRQCENAIALGSFSPSKCWQAWLIALLSI